MSDQENNEHSLQDDRPPRNKVRLAFTISLWLALILVVAAIFSPLRDMALNRIFPPSITPTTVVTAGDNLFYIQASPTGTITIDGRPVTQLPAVGTGSPIRLSRGEHKIAWQANPFPQLSCVVNVPSSIVNEQCNFESPITLNNGTNARLISFVGSLDSLPGSQRTSLTRSIQSTLNALQSTTTVQPGEPYYNVQSPSPNSLATATQPLKATLSFHLDTNINSPEFCGNYQQTVCSINGENCLQLCTIPSPSTSPATTQSAWNILALYYPTWSYTTLGGQTAVPDQHDPFIYPPTSPGNDYTIYMHIAWDGSSWHVNILSHTPPASNISLVYGNTQLPAAIDPSCASIDDGVSGPLSTIQGPQQAENVSWKFYTAPNRVDGCLGIATVDGQPNASPAYFLYRFGALLAVNNLAHTYVPSEPVADTTAQSIAQQIIAANKL
ncbi:MAG TPA: hypothetical protein VKU38_19965 [Ktedonobacteraceae bacterium]|nr:hypothetical protein [Ktedonobacteraceae bacterium]